jgi:hypothetical protein
VYGERGVRSTTATWGWLGPIWVVEPQKIIVYGDVWRTTEALRTHHQAFLSVSKTSAVTAAMIVLARQ